MTTDLANIRETKRTLDDIRMDREKLQRMCNQLADFKVIDIEKEATESQMALLYAQRMKVSITDLIQIEELLKQHLKNMEETDKVSGKL